MVCGCDASHFKASRVEVPDHIQEYWDAQFSATSHSSYRRRLRRWTKRYLPKEALYDEAFSTRPLSHAPNRHLNDLKIKGALNLLSGRTLRANLKSRFNATHKARMLRAGHLFENFISFAGARNAKERFSEDETKLLVEANAQGRS
ncbi:MAG: hypothetical protein LUP95_05685, partial [Euryarchaeota archaeon]|nr:hypothetical protein [Euryarchaeota archaeon]